MFNYRWESESTSTPPANIEGKESRFEYDSVCGKKIAACRLDPADGSQKRNWQQPAGSFITFPYKHNELPTQPDHLVILVEGEPKVEKLKKLGYDSTCNMGGSNAVDKTDWKALTDKTNIIIWPDNDHCQKGKKGRLWEANVTKELFGLGCTIRRIPVTFNKRNTVCDA